MTVPKAALPVVPEKAIPDTFAPSSPMPEGEGMFLEDLVYWNFDDEDGPAGFTNDQENDQDAPPESTAVTSSAQRPENRRELWHWW